MGDGWRFQPLIFQGVFLESTTTGNMTFNIFRKSIVRKTPEDRRVQQEIFTSANGAQRIELPLGESHLMRMNHEEGGGFDKDWWSQPMT